jgi:hypothetical protein
MRIASFLKIFKKFEPKIQRLRKFLNIIRGGLWISQNLKSSIKLEVLNKIKEPPNTGGFLFIYSRKTGFLEYLV